MVIILVMLPPGLSLLCPCKLDEAAGVGDGGCWLSNRLCPGLHLPSDDCRTWPEYFRPLELRPRRPPHNATGAHLTRLRVRIPTPCGDERIVLTNPTCMIGLLSTHRIRKVCFHDKEMNGP